jgi:hypothetical protein
MSQPITVYVSGEPVAISGTYEVVAATQDEKESTTEPAIRHLHIHETFPTHQGRVVSWYLITPIVPLWTRVVQSIKKLVEPV